MREENMRLQKQVGRTALAGLALLAASLGRDAVAAGTPAFIASAVKDAGRPAADRARDAERKPGEILAFFQLKPGQKVAELMPGDGYFTRILSKTVGPDGKVYVLGATGRATTVPGVVGVRGYANVRSVRASASSLNLPEQVDVVWTSLNYHDLKEGSDVAAFNKAAYQSLKPGGYYVVIDYSAQPGDAGARVERHRIDQRAVADEIAAAGFLKQAETQTLRHPQDPRTASSASMNGATDQFAMLFRKPDLSFGGAIRRQ